MITVLRQHGIRIAIFTDDHEPAHVHALGDGMAKIQLSGRGGGPELVFVVGMKEGDIRKAMALVRGNIEMLRQRWNEIHG